MLRTSALLLASGILCLILGAENWGMTFELGQLLLAGLTALAILTFFAGLIARASPGGL